MILSDDLRNYTKKMFDLDINIPFDFKKIQQAAIKMKELGKII